MRTMSLASLMASSTILSKIFVTMFTRFSRRSISAVAVAQSASVVRPLLARGAVARVLNDTGAVVCARPVNCEALAAVVVDKGLKH